MKHVIIGIAMCVLLVGSGCLFCQGTTEVQNNAPMRHATPQSAWDAVKTNPAIKQITLKRITKDQIQIGMKGIRETLEQSGVIEKVTILLQDATGKRLALGRFSPKKVSLGRNQNTINPQPEPPGFPSIRDVLICKGAKNWPTAQKIADPQPLEGKLVILNSLGRTKVEMPVSFIMEENTPSL